MSVERTKPEEDQPTDASGAARLDPAHLPPGYTLAEKYVIKKLLGEGANGSVYEGEHADIGHRVAIKVVHKNLAAREDIIARFRREARICGTIRNRHVGQVYDVGELPSGAPYMVMELQEGRSLAALLEQERRLPIASAIDIGRQLLLGLQAVHGIGAIHRDVKPDNIMLVRESTGDTVVKLVDFGISKSVDADIKNRNVTQEGMVVGSPDYMPPEQLKGDAIDHRVDIYAAGVVLYEMITGRVPFDARNMTELFVAILRDPLEPPSTVRSDCPKALEQVILRALERDAGSRFASAAEMEAALRKAQDVSGVSGDGLQRLSGVTPAARKRLSSTEGYALETERVRTAELQAPIKRAGSRLALIAGGIALALAGLLAVLLGPKGDGGSGHRVTPREQRSPGTAAASATKPAAVPANAAHASAVEPIELPSGIEEPSAPGAVGLQAEGTAQLEAVAQPERAGTEGAADIEDAPERSAVAKPAQRARRVAKVESPPSPPTEKAVAGVPEAAGTPPPAAGSSAAELVERASAAFIQGQMPLARALYRDATEQAAGNAAAWRGLGMASSRMGQPQEARRAFERYLRLRPNAPDAPAIRAKLDAL